MVFMIFWTVFTIPILNDLTTYFKHLKKTQRYEYFYSIMILLKEVAFFRSFLESGKILKIYSVRILVTMIQNNLL